MVASQDGLTAFLLAVNSGQTAVVMELLDRGADIEARTNVSGLAWQEQASSRQGCWVYCARVKCRC